MATHSAEFLDVHEEKGKGLHRSRSGGYVDFLEEQDKWQRRDRELQMKRYHDSRYSHKPQPSDRLYVPTFDNPGHRRVRSYGEIVEKKEEPVRTYNEPVRKYNVREQKPTYDLSGDAPLPTQLPVRQKTWKPQRGPSIKVQIHQEDTPSSAAPKQTPKKSPSASPRSPTGWRELQYRFAMLLSKLSGIEGICAPNLHVEAANPRDLTFSKIAEEVKGHAFQLRVWAHIVNVENTEKFAKEKRKTVELAIRALDRLLDRVSELSDACSKARPKDLKIELLPAVDDEDGYESYEGEDDESMKDVTETLGFEVQSHLDSIRRHIQTLGRLTRSLQDAAFEAKDEVEAVESLVIEVDRYFGSSQALDRYSIDTIFSGGKALEEARSAAGGSR